ncbi:MAG: winged helix-turn-helix transcriptional regulator [Solirubrobacterales bacterium]
MGCHRSYKDGCAGAHALDIVGERWGLLVVRELLLGPKRFSDLRESLPGISPNVLSQRLGELGEAGVLVHRRLPPPYSASVYELTEWGMELETVIAQIGSWGAKSPVLPRDYPLSVNSIVMSFRTMFDPSRAAGAEGSYELDIAGETFCATVLSDSIEIERGAAVDPLAVISGEPTALAQLAYDDVELAAAVEYGLVGVSGDRRAVKRFFALFTLPQPAAAPAAAA